MEKHSCFLISHWGIFACMQWQKNSSIKGESRNETQKNHILTFHINGIASDLLTVLNVICFQTILICPWRSRSKQHLRAVQICNGKWYRMGKNLMKYSWYNFSLSHAFKSTFFFYSSVFLLFNTSFRGKNDLFMCIKSPYKLSVNAISFFREFNLKLSCRWSINNWEI